MDTIARTLPQLGAATLICVLAASPTFADVVPINTLLSKGYEIKAMSSVQQLNGSLTGMDIYQGERTGITVGAVRNFLILQKGDSAYQCDNDGAKYINVYKCYAVKDWEPQN